MTKARKLKILLVFMVTAITTIIVWVHSIALNISDEDKIYIDSILINQKVGNFEAQSFNDEIKLIRKVQHAVLNTAPKDIGIPHNTTRGPKDLFQKKQGLCYDRSYTIEKILNSKGFEVRHISIFYKTDGKSSLEAFTTPGNPSHATTEVLTKKGWMIVDSNYKWLGLDQSDTPHSVEAIQKIIKENRIKSVFDERTLPHLYSNDFIFVYGLYSRHGRFYPPYNFIPDYNFRQLFYNF